MGVPRRFEHSKILTKTEENEAVVDLNEEEFVWVEWATEEEINEFLSNWNNQSLSMEQINEFLDSLCDEQYQEVIEKVEELIEQKDKLIKQKKIKIQELKQKLKADTKALEEENRLRAIELEEEYIRMEKERDQRIESYKERARTTGINMDDRIRVEEEERAKLDYDRRMVNREIPLDIAIEYIEKCERELGLA